MPRTVKKDANLQAGKPVKSANLSERASQEWDRLTAELALAGIEVTAAHRSLLSLGSTIAADIAEAFAAVETDGAYIESKAGLVAHPASKRLDALRRDYIKVLTMLGLRTRAVPQEDKERASLDDILNG